jgi:DNA-binding NarL/FixJ family response regulator
MVAQHRTAGDKPAPGRLTPREVQVLQRACLGQTNAEVAEDLGVTVHAIKFHLASIYRKLGVGNRTEAAVAYLTMPAPEQRSI